MTSGIKTYQGTNGWQYWYERGWKTWAAARFDANDIQIGDAEYQYTRSEIEAIACARENAP